MFSKCSKAVLAAAVFFVPVQLFAGGPAWLCVPIDGVTSTNQTRCAELLQKQLGDAVFHLQGENGIRMQQHEGQWFATFHLKRDVRLSEMESAFQGTSFSVPRDRLRLFGHVILEAKFPKPNEDTLKAQLETLSYVAVAKTDRVGKSIQITLDLPYPTEQRRESNGTRFWEDRFRWGELNTTMRRSDTPATTKTLPGLAELKKAIENLDAEYRDVVWSPEYACRAIGAVTVRETRAVTKAK